MRTNCVVTHCGAFTRNIDCIKEIKFTLILINQVGIFEAFFVKPPKSLSCVLYGCETWSLTLRAERRLRVFENRVLRRIFGPKRDDYRGVEKTT